ncbi:MAG: glycine cleavage system aminomethyltransferase GcvT, partial [Gammaproteobacteria bacterium]|nr:glycine cleavage system aminomethyltransferase GcvT [Gammaproteobacteria bacterium]
VVTNASTNEKDMAWMARQAATFDVALKERRDLALLAVQGPNALARCNQVLEPEFAKCVGALNRFQGAFYGEEFVGRTGYTGEDGIELIVTGDTAKTLWLNFFNAGVQACGLGARDTLRLEAGMSLYGNDLDENHTPAESGLAWSVANKDQRDFIGKDALAKPARHKMIGLTLQDRGVLRGHQQVMVSGKEIGEITSGTFSPTLEQSIALARVRSDTPLEIGDQVQIAVRKNQLNAVVSRFPFVKQGKATN